MCVGDDASGKSVSQTKLHEGEHDRWPPVVIFINELNLQQQAWFTGYLAAHHYTFPDSFGIRQID